MNRILDKTPVGRVKVSRKKLAIKALALTVTFAVAFSMMPGLSFAQDGSYLDGPSHTDSVSEVPDSGNSGSAASNESDIEDQVKPDSGKPETDGNQEQGNAEISDPDITKPEKPSEEPEEPSQESGKPETGDEKPTGESEEPADTEGTPGKNDQDTLTGGGGAIM